MNRKNVELELKNLELANGNEAVAWAALAAGVDYFAHYPGSPINLVEPALKKLTKKFDAPITFNDSLNEHIAALACAGASFSGARSLLVMKHVGMNIAADPFNYIGYTGVKGGMVIVVGTDPGANSSTGEEDTHWYVPQTNFPLLEPTSVQEIYTYVQKGFEISEKISVPVLVFIPGRLCYNFDFIEVKKEFSFNHENKKFYFEKDDFNYINVGQRAINNHRSLIERVKKLATDTPLYKSTFNSDAAVGIVTRGLTFGHAFESINKLGIADRVHLINCDLVYPLHRETMNTFFKGKEEIIIIEDQDGFLENRIKMDFFNDINCTVYGKEFFPAYGEIVFTRVHEFLANKFNIDIAKEELPIPSENIPERLGTFCEGCPHRASYFGIDRALDDVDGIIGGDIGCSSLPPFRADWLMCMNAGIGISQGMSHILKDQTVISTGGESTFFHGGIISLQSAVLNKIDLIHIVFDNRVVAMTGHQESPTTYNNVDYKKLLKSIGVHRVIEVTNNKSNKLTRILKKEMKLSGVRVIWVNEHCARMANDFTQLKRNVLYPKIDNNKCGDCTACYDQLACPAINIIEQGKRDLAIDAANCMRCGACHNICPNGGIQASLACSIPEFFRHGLAFISSKFRGAR